MIFDTHIHTELSTDSDMKLEEALRTASRKKLGLTITEHMDWEFPMPQPNFRVNLAEFWEKYQPFRSETTLLGIELGMTKSSQEKNREIIRKHEFDFVLGSIHVLYGKEVYTELFQEMDERLVYRDYLEMAAHLVQELDIDSFAHIDYPLRYCQSELTFEEYEPQFLALFDALVKTGTCLELNTARLNRGEAVYRNMLQIYKAYGARGGKYVTLGSDAHDIQAIGRNFDIAEKLLNEAKLTPVYFVKRELKVV